MQRHFNQLKEEFAKMKPPPDLDADTFKMAVQNGPSSANHAAASSAASPNDSARNLGGAIYGNRSFSATNTFLSGV